MTETKQLTLVDKISQEVGLPITDAEKIVASFGEIAKRINDWENKLVKFNKIDNTEITKEICDEARELRLEGKKIRTDGDKKHKEMKERSLLIGRAIDGVKNVYTLKIKEREDNLEKIEKYFEALEQAKKDKVNAERELQLSKYVADISMYNYKEMANDVFANLIITVKKIWDTEQESIKKAEADKIELEQKQKEEQEQIRIENAKLKLEAEAREKELQKERAEQKKKLEAEQLKSKKEAEAREKIEAELKAKKDKEEQDIKEAKAKEQAEKLKKLEEEKTLRLAPDKDKLFAYAKALENIDVPELQTQEAKMTLTNALKLLSQVLITLKIK